jgi:hypothetical protein
VARPRTVTASRPSELNQSQRVSVIPPSYQSQADLTRKWTKSTKCIRISMSSSDRWFIQIPCFHHSTRLCQAYKKYHKGDKSDKCIRISMPSSERGSKSPLCYHGTRLGLTCGNPCNHATIIDASTRNRCSAQDHGNGPRIQVHLITRSNFVSLNTIRKSNRIRQKHAK